MIEHGGHIGGATLDKYSVDERENIVDQRPFLTKIIDGLRDYETARKAIFLVMIAYVCLSVIPFAAEFFLLFILPFVWFFAIRDLKTRVYDFPSMVPKALNRNDGCSTPVGDADTNKGVGNLFFGSVQVDKKVASWYLPDSVQRIKEQTQFPVVSSFLDGIKHIIITGTTNSGKTEMLYVIFLNAILTQNGLHFTDGKGALDALIRLFEILRRYGREDDLLVTNFKVDKSVSVYDKKKQRPWSNSYDIFRTQAPATLDETLRSFLDGAGPAKDSIWVGRASTLISGLTRPLMYLAEKGLENLTIRTFIQHMSLDKIEELLFDKTKMYGPEFAETTTGLMEFMVSVHPQYSEAMRGQLPFDSLKQFMFASMQLNRTQSEFTYNFGNIFDVLVGDIDPEDVVANKRAWISILPSVENSFTTMQLLGRMQIEAGRQALAAMMVGSTSGNTRKILFEMSSMSKRWFADAYDEIAYYATDGFSILPAQARAYGMCSILSLQEISSLKRMGDAESDETVSNTAIKIFMRTSVTEESETWKTIKGYVGSVEVKVHARLKGGRRVFRRQQVSTEQKTISVPRATYTELTNFKNGEMVFIYPKRLQNRIPDSGVVIARGLYVAPEKNERAMQSVTVHDLLPTEPYVKSQVNKIAYKKALFLQGVIEQGNFSDLVREQIDPSNDVERHIADFVKTRADKEVYMGGNASDLDLLREFIESFNHTQNPEIRTLRAQVSAKIMAQAA